MQIELNRQYKDCLGEYIQGDVRLVAGDTYWFARIRLYEDQYMIATPRSYLDGNKWAIGFARGNKTPRLTPSDKPAEDIYETIRHNKTYGSLPKSKCLGAIELLQDALIKDL